MKVVLAGGTGFIGQLLMDHWKDEPISIVVLSRKPYRNHDRVPYITWDGATLGPWASELDGADVLINLAGKSVDCRYTERNRTLIMQSRIESTAILGTAIRQVTAPPRLWINSASATIYSHTLDRQMDEATGETDNDRPAYQFSVQVCKRWEQTFWEAPIPQSVRKVALRMAIILGREGGVFPVLKRLVKFGLGGKMGRGDQFVSWLHERDLVRIINFIIENDHIKGTYNVSAPKPIRNRDLMTLLRQTFRMPFELPATEWMLAVGTFLLRTEPELVLKSRNVVPRRLLEAGFQFEFDTADKAVNDLIASRLV